MKCPECKVTMIIYHRRLNIALYQMALTDYLERDKKSAGLFSLKALLYPFIVPNIDDFWFTYYRCPVCEYKWVKRH